MSIVLALCVVLISAQSIFAQGFAIDSPIAGSVQSGAVSPPNGWKCPRNGQITARIDGGPELQFTEDLSRGGYRWGLRQQRKQRLRSLPLELE